VKQNSAIGSKQMVYQANNLAQALSSPSRHTEEQSNAEKKEVKVASSS